MSAAQPLKPVENASGAPRRKQPGWPQLEPAVPVRAAARPARMRRRHWGLLGSFIALVLLPVALTCWYLWTRAEDRFASVTAFTVRAEETNPASDMLGGLAQFTGSGTKTDSDILYDYILSRQMVDRVDAAVGLKAHVQAHWATDPVFSLWPSATVEDLEWFWHRVVHVSYDQGSGLTELEVRAFDPAMAQRIATAIVAEAQGMINALSDQAREDATAYARADLTTAEARLREARQALTTFRVKTQILDPEADIEGRMGVMNSLQAQLAEELLEADLLRSIVKPEDPRIDQIDRRIAVIRDRIQKERVNFTTTDGDSSLVTEDYPTLMAEFERLSVDRQFAEEAYRAALAAVDMARANAERQSRYLATYVSPTLAEAAEYPRRVTTAALAALFLLLAWSVVVLVWYAIRDRA